MSSEFTPGSITSSLEYSPIEPSGGGLFRLSGATEPVHCVQLVAETGEQHSETAEGKKIGALEVDHGVMQGVHRLRQIAVKESCHSEQAVLGRRSKAAIFDNVSMVVNKVLKLSRAQSE